VPGAADPSIRRIGRFAEGGSRHVRR
jgi:hypothetical protein